MCAYNQHPDECSIALPAGLLRGAADQPTSKPVRTRTRSVVEEQLHVRPVRRAATRASPDDSAGRLALLSGNAPTAPTPSTTLFRLLNQPLRFSALPPLALICPSNSPSNKINSTSVPCNDIYPSFTVVHTETNNVDTMDVSSSNCPQMISLHSNNVSQFA